MSCDCKHYSLLSALVSVLRRCYVRGMRDAKAHDEFLSVLEKCEKALRN